MSVTATVAIRTGAVPAPPGGIAIGPFLVVLAQLGILTVVLRQFQIESGAFVQLAVLAFAGFAVHAWLPLNWRLPFFAALSVVAIGLVLGVANALALLALGLLLIGLCHLPIPFKARVALVLAVGVLLAAMRAEWVPYLWSDAIWPILGSMFMFRLIVYLYDLKHETAPATPARTLAYFFMLPNVCFPLFPVIDYRTFRRNYFDRDAYEIYQVGVSWMVRGVIHLILYRFIYHYLTLAPSEVLGPGDLVRYLVANFLLYLRISGQFHLIVGMLYLFGFRLPETHHLYLLASSFTDFWRRINIYWKDFMLKIFYYPTYFAIRGIGATRAMVVATMWVFVLTWALHAYQWFWLRGTMLLVWQDVLFWAILGALVVVNALWEIRHGRERSLGKASRSWKSLTTLALSTAATFCFICVLWSFWTSESVAAWLSLWRAVGAALSADLGVYPGVLLAAVIAGAAARGQSGGAPAGGGKRKARWQHPALLTTAALIVLLLAGIEDVHRRLGTTVATVVHTLRSASLNRLDHRTLERGYYEQLLRVDRFNSQLWEVYSKKPVRWLSVEGAGIKRFVEGFLGTELIPSNSVSTSFGTISINRWGMRDQDYELKPAPGTYRMALLGPSTVMGWGVTDGETFEALVESRLNREGPGAPVRKYEILNFGVPGFDPPQQLMMLDRALGFTPDAVIYVATGNEASRAAGFLASKVVENVAIPYDYLREVIMKAGVTPGMDKSAAWNRVGPYRWEVLDWIYGRIAETLRARGMTPVLVFLPQVREGAWLGEVAGTLRAAEKAGFVVISLADIYKGQDIAALKVAAWDDHPNPLGHQLIAARLYDALRARQDVLFQERRQARGDERGSGGKR